VHFVAYRKRAHLGKRALEQLESQIRQALEDRVHLQRLLQPESDTDLHVQGFRITAPEQAERVADELRNQWNLGHDPLPSVIGVLEDHNIHVIEMDAADEFDGLSAFAQEDGRILAAAVIARTGAPGERQRFNLCHELGHLILDVHEAQDARLAETAAHRFAGAFLAPAVTLRRAIGGRRQFIQLEELLLLKQRFGMSIQALLYRLRDLHIITESHFKQWCVDISQRGWRTNEPQPLPSEQPVWLRQHVLRAFAEEAISRAEATDLLGTEVNLQPPLGLIERRAFLKLPIAERRRILAEQAQKAAAQYETDRDWQGGDIVEY
jgi:Zn-dependent peptidase ImmA (M78 family)